MAAVKPAPLPDRCWHGDIVDARQLRHVRRREWQILLLVGGNDGQGTRSNKQIAYELGVSENYVRATVSSLIRLLDARNRAGLAVMVEQMSPSKHHAIQLAPPELLP